MEEHSIPLCDLLPVIRDVLATGSEFSLKPRGKSMLPYLREGRDTVVLSPVTDPPKRGDILLYVRWNGTPVLHRVVRIEEDGTFTMRGDNQYSLEKGIADTQVVATVKRFYRREREMKTDALGARLYLMRRAFTYPFRRIARAVLRRIKRLFERSVHHG